MQLYKANTNKLTLGGVEYVADDNGIIDVPDDKVSSSVWGWGFVSAKGRLAQLEREAAESVAVSAAADPVVAKPAKPAVKDDKAN